MSEITIEIKGLNFAYESKKVLSSIYLKIESGHIHGLIGPNGAGKSTLFKCILGQIEAQSGSIKLFGQDHKTQLTKIAYVPQKDQVDWSFPILVKDVVKMGRYAHKKWWEWTNAEDRKIAQEAMERVEISELADRQIGELSGGQQQRVFLARAICQNADIIMMDEPFVGIDAKTEHRMISILKDLAALNKTILVVHHDLDSVLSYFDRVILIHHRLIAYGDTSVVFTKENISLTFASQSHLLQKPLSK